MTPSFPPVSDPHLSYEENREVVDRIRPRAEDDWLIVAGAEGDYGRLHITRPMPLILAGPA